jgi:hypothetical protein
LPGLTRKDHSGLTRVSWSVSDLKNHVRIIPRKLRLFLPNHRGSSKPRHEQPHAAARWRYHLIQLWIRLLDKVSLGSPWFSIA